MPVEKFSQDATLVSNIFFKWQISDGMMFLVIIYRKMTMTIVIVSAIIRKTTCKMLKVNKTLEKLKS